MTQYCKVNGAGLRLPSSSSLEVILRAGTAHRAVGAASHHDVSSLQLEAHECLARHVTLHVALCCEFFLQRPDTETEVLRLIDIEQENYSTTYDNSLISTPLG